MKIRNGFVSNSSSSSFCIYGAEIDETVLVEVLKKKDPSFNGDTYDLNIGTLTVQHMSESDSVYVGRSWSSIGDKETGEQFKKDIEDQLKALELPSKCSTIEEAWDNH